MGDIDEELRVMQQNLYTGYIEANNDLHINFLRPIKKEMYMCSAKCCEDEKMSEYDHLVCIKYCFLKTSGATYYISSTMDDIKRRYNTCLGKCASGVGYDPMDKDDEGSDGEIPAEELKEPSFEDEPHPEYLMNTWFNDLDKDDLEYEDEEKPDDKVDFKDQNTCSRLCTKDYIEVLNDAMNTVRRDLAATALAKSEQAGYYYDWSRANDESLPF